mmetsp:Transcript_22199/g.50112  ORF Transcript_22199/g.50112 Transcript_22199/m.50112 type:complete len:378 (-) Transcript_22199:221-1354(-)
MLTRGGIVLQPPCRHAAGRRQPPTRRLFGNPQRGSGAQRGRCCSVILAEPCAVRDGGGSSGGEPCACHQALLIGRCRSPTSCWRSGERHLRRRLAAGGSGGWQHRRGDGLGGWDGSDRLWRLFTRFGRRRHLRSGIDGRELHGGGLLLFSLLLFLLLLELLFLLLLLFFLAFLLLIGRLLDLGVRSRGSRRRRSCSRQRRWRLRRRLIATSSEIIKTELLVDPIVVDALDLLHVALLHLLKQVVQPILYIVDVLWCQGLVVNQTQDELQLLLVVSAAIDQLLPLSSAAVLLLLLAGVDRLKLRLVHVHPAGDDLEGVCDPLPDAVSLLLLWVLLRGLAQPLLGERLGLELLLAHLEALHLSLNELACVGEWTLVLDV